LRMASTPSSTLSSGVVLNAFSGGNEVVVAARTPIASFPAR